MAKIYLLKFLQYDVIKDMAGKKEKLMIIDGNALIHRSFHALPPTMRTRNGEIVNAVYGFASFLLKAMQEIKPEYVVLTLDKKGPTFRHEKFKEYKIKRVKAPDELYEQIPKVKILARALNIPIFEQSGFEADDLIGTIVKQTEEKDLPVKNVIITGDKDTLQLVDENTSVYSMSRGIAESILYDERQVFERMGLRPDQVVDYKALRGDPSDNIPGVPGIGDKTALELLRDFDSLENLYKKIESDDALVQEKIKPRIIELLKNKKKEAYLSRELAEIKTDVPLDFDLKATRFLDFDMEKAFKVFGDFEFKSLLPRLQNIVNGNSGSKEENQKISDDKFARNQKSFKYISVSTEPEFKKFLTELKKQKSFAFDTETSGLDPINCDLLGISFSWKKGEAYFLQLRLPQVLIENKKPEAAEQGSLFVAEKKTDEIVNSGKKEWLEKIKAIFVDQEIKKFAHNGKFDIRVLKNFGLEVNNFTFDTMLAAYLLNPGSRQYSLDSLVFSEFGFEKISKEDLLGKGREKISFSELDSEKLNLYSGEDADFTLRLQKKLKAELRECGMKKLFQDIEVPLVPVLVDMEENGIRLDKEFLKKMERSINKKIRTLEQAIHKEAGVEFNIKSTKQLKEVLFEKLEIPSDNIKKTKTGLSTAADELFKLKELHPIIPLIQEHRELVKLANTYIEALPKLIKPKTGRVHTNYNQTIAATGRLSSSDPNLQNIPIRTDLGRKIRRAFVAESGSVLAALDYSQIELRLAAHMSEDKKMIKAFQDGADIHTATAAEINRLRPEEVSAEMRREAKAINFGVLYGQGPHGLMLSADISYQRAKEFIDQYFSAYAGIKKYIDGSIESAREIGYAETIFGRRRYLPEINSTIPMVKKGAERMAINTPIQGTSADMIKLAMIKIFKIIKDKKDIKMLLQVHDELVFEIKLGKEKAYIAEIKKIMENIIKLKVPVVVDAKIGKNWGEMTPV